MRTLVLLAASASILLPQAAPPAVDIAQLVKLASGWTVRFETSLSGVLFHERYEQSLSADGVTMRMNAGAPLSRSTGGSGNLGRLFLEANIFLIKPPGADRFVVYRDIYRTGRDALEDHTDRLQALLVENTASSFAHAKRLTDASARLNVGPIDRNINTPTMAFEYLKPEHLARLRVRPVGREVVDGRELVVIEFQEIGSPTLVRGENDADSPATGRYWIDPASGAVPRAAIELKVSPYTGRLEVKLALHDEMKIWVPTEMTEVWTAGTRRVNGLAHYDRFQRLAVSTEEIVK